MGTNLSMPRPSRPELGQSAWPSVNAPPMGYGGWPNLNAPPPYFDPGSMPEPPVPLSLAKPSRRGRTIVAWSLWMLAMGLAAGPLLAEYADQGVEMGIEWLVKWTPNFLQPYLPKPLKGNVLLPQASRVVPVIPAAPSIATARTTAEPPEPAPPVAKPLVEAKAPEAMATAIQPEPRRKHVQTRKTRGSHRRAVASARAEVAASRPKPTRHRRGEWDDPFESGPRTATATEPPAKPAAEPAAPKSRPAKAGDSLDDLMAGAASPSQAKDRRSSSREIDAMLQDVQKSRPAPRPARAEPEPLPSLTQSEIASAMAGVKNGAKACGQRFGQNGVADLRMVVGKDGKVTDVAVRGMLAGMPISDCIAQAARGASFPPNNGLKFNYRVDVR